MVPRPLWVRPAGATAEETAPPETHLHPAGPRSDLQHHSRDGRDPRRELTMSLPDPTELDPKAAGRAPYLSAFQTYHTQTPCL